MNLVTLKWSFNLSKKKSIDKKIEILKQGLLIHTRSRPGRNYDLALIRLEICKECESFSGKRCIKAGCCGGQENGFMALLSSPNEVCPSAKWSNVTETP